MRSHPLVAAMCCLIVASLETPRLQGQFQVAGPITGQGQVDLKKQPQKLRVYVNVLAKGKTLREALDKLREQKQTARRYLELFGAPPDSVRFGEPQIETEKNDARHQQMRMMMAMRNQAAGQGTKPKTKEPPSIMVSCSLSTEIPLKPANAEELLLAAHALEERIKAADLGGTKGLKQASAQDEELAQEQAAMFGDPSLDEGRKPGDPIFTYICKITDEERTKAMARAFAEAKSEAILLARAANVELGRLASIVDTSSQEAFGEEGVFMRSGRAFIYDQRTGAVQISEPDESRHEHEALGPQPTRVHLRITISVAFDVNKR
jgi:hypothetical protein